MHKQTNVRGGHFLRDDIESFDAPFFSMSPMEAASLDPQQRSLLEITYQALENGELNDPECVFDMPLTTTNSRYTT